MSSEPQTAHDERLVTGATCLGCGCACDDIDVIVRRGRIIEARQACTLGTMWFGDGTAPAMARVDGRDSTIDEALEAAARSLARAARPLVYLAPDISCDVQREGVAIADALRATLDSVTSATAIGSVLAAQERGRAGTTLGEIRNRADVVVFWGVDPDDRYPRYRSRYAVDAIGLHVPEGRRSRRIIAVDVGEARGPADADVRVALTADEEMAAISALVAAIADGEQVRLTPQVRLKPDTTRTGSTELLQVLLSASYLVFVADAETGADRGRADGLIALTQTLNARTRCALSLLRGGGNRTGADAVTTWQTGYPLAVDFARGYPRYRPLDGTAAARLRRGEIDAALVMGSAALVPDDVLGFLTKIRCAVIGPRASECALSGAGVVVDAGVAGIHDAGMALRMDDVPVPLRSIVSGPPAATALAASLRTRASRYRDALRFHHPRRAASSQ